MDVSTQEPRHEPALRRGRDARADMDGNRRRLAFKEHALRSIPDGVVAVDPEGIIIEFNPGAAHLTGWSERQALGKPLQEVVQLRDAEQCAVDILAADSRQGRDVAALVRRDRHVVLVDATSAPILDQGHQTIGTVLVFRNVTSAKRLNEELTYHATHDPLTDVVNRRAFETRLQRAVTHAASRESPHALLFLDLDRFKAVNDTAGHVAGDELLQQLALLLKQHLREHDTLGRLGGDEFAILLEACPPQRAEAVAERIRAAVAGFRFEWQEACFEIGVSIGLVDFHDGTLSPRQLLRRADALCYAAKTAGRNRVVAAHVESPQARKHADA